MATVMRNRLLITEVLFFAVIYFFLLGLADAKPQHVFRMKVEDLKGGVRHGDSPSTLAFAKHFQNDMVLQRGPQRANIYGFSPDIGTKLILTLEDTAAETREYYETTIKKGNDPGVGVWMFTLNPKPAGTTVSISVMGEGGSLTLTGVIYGDVWVCSGQSNMEFTVGMMARAKEELADAHNYPNVRIFAAAEKVSTTPLDDLLAVLEPWSKPSDKTLGGGAWTFFSAVCWMFGKNIHKALGIPIGLVDTNWGGTPVEAWSSPEALAKCGLMSGEEMSRAGQSPIPISHTSGQGNVRGPQQNSVLWNAMVYPLLGMTIYGAVWYQGEADSHHPQVEHYNCTFPAMIDDWRDKFHKTSRGETSDTFPFGFVQLASNVPDPSITFGLPDIRWHQTADYGYVPNPRMGNVFMAVAMDLPGFLSPYGTIHPQDKTDVGFRLALSGLQYAYNRSEVCQGPYPSKALVTGSEVVITYINTQKLVIKDWTGFDLLCKPKNTSSTERSVWIPTSLIANTDTTVSLYLHVCPAGHEVKGLRYAWRESPCSFKKCAVYGDVNDLPAAQFVAYANKSAEGEITFDFTGPTSI